MSNAEEIEEAAATWVAREDRGLEPDGLEALNQWVVQSTAHRVAYLRIKKAWDRADRLAALRSPEPVMRRELPYRFEAPYSRIAAVALILLFLCGVTMLFYRQPASNLFATNIGQQRTVNLSDGTRIRLNTNTRIQAEVTSSARTVTLDQGEAYFEVVHDPLRPFVVLAGNRRITDLGTKFSVDRNGSNVEVVVKEGRVRVDVVGTPAAAVPMFANDNHIVIANADETLVAAKRPQEITDELDWRYGMLVFNDETLADAAAEFNRYSKKQILVVGDVREIRIGGSFRADNVDAFIFLLREGFDLSVEEQNNEIVISK